MADLREFLDPTTQHFPAHVDTKVVVKAHEPQRRQIQAGRVVIPWFNPWFNPWWNIRCQLVLLFSVSMVSMRCRQCGSILKGSISSTNGWRSIEVCYDIWFCPAANPPPKRSPMAYGPLNNGVSIDKETWLTKLLNFEAQAWRAIWNWIWCLLPDSCCSLRGTNLPTPNWFQRYNHWFPSTSQTRNWWDPPMIPVNMLDVLLILGWHSHAVASGLSERFIPYTGWKPEFSYVYIKGHKLIGVNPQSQTQNILVK